jgi:histidine ammonia-lyase
MLLRLATLTTGRTGVRPVVAADVCRDAQRRDHPRRPRIRLTRLLGDLAPLSHCALALMGEGPVRLADGTERPPRAARLRPRHRADRAAREGGPGPHQRHRRHARHAHPGPRRPASSCATWPTSRRDERRGPARHRRGLPPTCRPLRPHPGQASRPPTCSARSPDSPIRPRTTPRTARVQDAYSLRCAPQVTRRGPRHGRACGAVAAYELASTDRQPGGDLDGRVESNGNFHGAPGGLRARLPRDRRGRRREHVASGAPTASSTAPAATDCRPSSRTTRESTAG